LFNKIALSDAFMFCGHCQYCPKSWHSRNFIRTGMLSLPVHKGPSINETEIAGEHWLKEHLRSIKLAYSKYPFFDDYFPILQNLMGCSWLSLGELNTVIIKYFLEWLEIKKEVLSSDWYEIKGHKTEMLISMCKAVGADEYLSNEGSRAYVDEELLAVNGIKHRWQKFKDPDYGQEKLIYHGKEQPLSVIDLLFSKGPEAGEIVRTAGHVD
jgi:hypothetical protein